MKLHILSDLHLEFGPAPLPEVDADVVILAGDIGKGLNGVKYAMDRFGDQPVIYLAGNHEYYGKALPRLTEKMRDLAEGSRVEVMENDVLEIGNTRFIGCTLWTDYGLFGEGVAATQAMAIAQDRMTDFQVIRLSPEYRRVRPHDFYRIHQESRVFLEGSLAKPFDGRTVVVTHHAPSMRSIPPRYQGEVLSAAFASDLEDMVERHAIDLWVHGHTHWCVDYELHGTRVISNQRGYPDEMVEGFDPGCVVELR